MSSLADLPELFGFFSYSREDDADSQGALSALRGRIQGELRGQLGRTVNLWQDKEAIQSGALWETKIKNAVAQSVFFIPIITPTAVASRYCQFELDAFLAREAALGRDDLVFPVLYIDVPELRDNVRREKDPVLALIAKRQYFDWRDFRYLDTTSTDVRKAAGRFCTDIRDALYRSWVSPEERAAQEKAAALQHMAEQRKRQEAEAKRRAEEETRQRAEEEERRKHEAELKQRVAEERAQREGDVEVEVARKAEEERKGTEVERKRAELKPQSQSDLQQEPQPPIRPYALAQWQFALVGAITGAMPLLLFLGAILATAGLVRGFGTVGTLIGAIVWALICAACGASAGLIENRFGIFRSIAIAYVPTVLILFMYIYFVMPPTGAGAALTTIEISVVGNTAAAVATTVGFVLLRRWRFPRRTP